MIINKIKFLMISAVIIIIFLLPFFNIEGHGALRDTPQNVEYEIKFKIPDRWKYLPDYNIDTSDDISTTSFVLTQNDSIIKTKGKTLYGYLIMIRITDDIPLPMSSKQWAKTQIIDISGQSNKYRLTEPSDLNKEFNIVPISKAAYHGYTYTIEDKIKKKIKVKTELINADKLYEFEYIAPNTNHDITYKYINNYKEILQSVEFVN